MPWLPPSRTALGSEAPHGPGTQQEKDREPKQEARCDAEELTETRRSREKGIMNVQLTGQLNINTRQRKDFGAAVTKADGADVLVLILGELICAL